MNCIFSRRDSSTLVQYFSYRINFAILSKSIKIVLSSQCFPPLGDSTHGLQQGIDHREQVEPGWFTRAREQTPSNRAGCQRRPQVLLGQLLSPGCCASSSKGGGASAFLGVSCALYLVADPGRSRQKFSASSASWLFLLGQSLQDADNDQRLRLFCVSWRDRFQKDCARRLGVLLGR